MVSVNKDNFQQEVIESPLPVMVDFFGQWCPPCKVLGPIIEELDKEFQGKIKITKLNIDENLELAQKYGVMSVPTLIFFKNGKKVNRVIGLVSKEEIKKEIEKVL